MDRTSKQDIKMDIKPLCTYIGSFAKNDFSTSFPPCSNNFTLQLYNLVEFLLIDTLMCKKKFLAVDSLHYWYCIVYFFKFEKFNQRQR